jgi:hypothetical protein
VWKEETGEEKRWRSSWGRWGKLEEETRDVKRKKKVL